VIVIIASVIVFQNPMSTQSKICTMIALAGVFAYSQAKRLTGKAKAAPAMPETLTTPALGEQQG
jgi:solute carrier family 35, member E1